MKQYIEDTLVSIIKESKDPMSSAGPIKFTTHKSTQAQGTKGGYQKHNK